MGPLKGAPEMASAAGAGVLLIVHGQREDITLLAGYQGAQNHGVAHVDQTQPAGARR